MRCEARRGQTHISQAGCVGVCVCVSVCMFRGGVGGSSWSDALLVFGSARSFSDRQEQRATGTSPHWVCLNFQLSVSLLMASGGGSGVAGVLVLKM